MTMTDLKAIELLESLTDKEARKEARESLTVRIVTLLMAANERVKAGEEPEDGEPEAVWTLLSWLLRDVDIIERDLIRFLMYESEEDRKWQDVADLSGGRFATRQAIQKRWSRLTESTRRTTTRDMRRGAAIPRSPSVVVDATTQTASRTDGETA
jgi:hypothetical protein